MNDLAWSSLVDSLRAEIRRLRETKEGLERRVFRLRGAVRDREAACARRREELKARDRAFFELRKELAAAAEHRDALRSWVLSVPHRDDCLTSCVCGRDAALAGLPAEARQEHTKEFEAACNGEIDLIPACDVGDDLLAELDDWAEIGWVLLECGCLVSPSGLTLHAVALGEAP